MGYDLHITRRKSPNDTASITPKEWLAYLQSDSELQLDPNNGPHVAIWRPPTQIQAFLDWYDGEIYSKNPDPPAIDKMIAIAKSLNATVVGDDGETYPRGVEPTAPVQKSKLNFLQRLTNLFSKPSNPKPAPHTFHHLPAPFAVGDTVIDTYKNELTVVSIDPTAAHGVGIIKTRNRKGIIVGHAMIAHDLKPKPLPPKKTETTL